MALLSLPSELVTVVLEHLLADIGIRGIVHLRTVCR